MSPSLERPMRRHHDPKLLRKSNESVACGPIRLPGLVARRARRARAATATTLVLLVLLILLLVLVLLLVVLAVIIKEHTLATSSSPNNLERTYIS